MNEDDGGMNAFMRPCAFVYGIEAWFTTCPHTRAFLVRDGYKPL